MKEIEMKVNSLRLFYNQGKTKDLDTRLEYLQKLKGTIVRYEKEVLEALNKDLNKTPYEAFMTEFGMVLDEINFISKRFKKWAKPKKVKTPITQFPAKSYIYKEPYGVVLIMSPWNYPFYLTLAPLVGAIAAGNTVVLKPSNYSGHTSLIIEKIIKEVFPQDYVTVVLGGREENTELLNQKFDYIFFTGSPNVGKIVMEKASQNLTPVSLELGGKSPCIVDKDANIDLAAKRIAWGKFVNAGQTCVAPDYVLVDERVKDNLIRKLIRYTKDLYEGSIEKGLFPKIITERHYERVVGLIDEGKVIYSLGKSEYPYIQPTLQLATWDDKIMGEEIFGPVLPILTYTDLDEAINNIINRPRPLALYLFTENKRVEKKVIGSINYGGGCVNDVIVHLATPHMPFGGIGNSGMGGYHGKYSFDTFTHLKSVLKKSNKLDINLRYPPYNKDVSILKKFFK